MLTEVKNVEAESSATPVKKEKPPRGQGVNFTTKKKSMLGEHVAKMGYVIDHEKRKIKVYPESKIVDGQGAAGSRAAGMFDFTPGLNNLLHSKTLSMKGNNKPTEDDVEAYKQLVLMMPHLTDGFGRHSARYAMIHGTKPRVNAPVSNEGKAKLLHEFEVNVGEYEAGNTSKELLATMRQQVKQMKASGLIDDVKKAKLLAAFK
jgi:hypothetical protein